MVEALFGSDLWLNPYLVSKDLWLKPYLVSRGRVCALSHLVVPEAQSTGASDSTKFRYIISHEQYRRLRQQHQINPHGDSQRKL